MTNHYKECSAEIHELNRQSARRFRHEISEDGLKEDWMVRRKCLGVCGGGCRHLCVYENILNPAPVGVDPLDPCAIMSAIDVAMDKLLHHPSSSSIGEQWQYAIDAKEMYDLLFRLIDRDEFDWLAPYIVYVGRLLDNIMPDIIPNSTKLEYDLDGELQYYCDLPCKLPTDLKALDSEKLVRAIEAAAKKAAVELERANNGTTADWESARDIICQCFADAFEGFCSGAEVKYVDKTGATRLLYIPNLDSFDIPVSGIGDFYKAMNSIFDLIKNPTSAQASDCRDWSAVKECVNYALNFARFFSVVYNESCPPYQYIRLAFAAKKLAGDIYRLIRINDSGFLWLAQDQWYRNTCKLLEQKRIDVVKCLLRVLKYIKGQSLAPLAESKILVLIRNQCQNIGKEFVDAIDKRIEELRGDATPPDDPARWDRVLDETLELEEDARQLQAAKTQKEMFIDINHSIKNIIPSINCNLSMLQRRLPSESDFVNHLLKQARQGTTILSDYAMAITCSYRKLGEELWAADILQENATFYVRDVFFESLLYSIPHMFFRSFSLYERESENYFPEERDMNVAEESWCGLNDRSEQIKWIEQHLFHLSWEDASIADVKIGDKNSTKTYLLVFFNEIFLNAVKAISYVNKPDRRLKVSLRLADQGLFVNIQNSAVANRKKGAGHGRTIINNFAKVFDIKDLFAGLVENGNYEIRFTIPMFSTPILRDKK